MTWTLRTAAAVALVAGSVVMSGVGVASAAVARARVGSVARLPPTAHVEGPVPASRPVSLTVSLAGRDPLTMQRLAAAVSTPGSADFRRYLDVRQFAARFGAPRAEITAVTRTLRADGLAVSRVSANHMMLSVAGTAAVVQRAFQTRLDAVRTGEDRRAFADRRTPTLPASIAPDVDAVIGLNTLYAPQSDQVARPGRQLSPLADALGAAAPHVATGGPQPCTAAVAASQRKTIGGYTADEIQAGYNFSGLYAAGDLAAGQTVAVYELEKVDPADLAVYQRCYRTHARLTYVDTGHPRFMNDAEAGLDLEQIIGLAPDVHLIVYEAPDSFSVGVRQFDRIVAQNRARTVSVSWGLCEAKITFDHSDLSIVRAEDKIFQEAALQGQSILSASGDSGSAGCETDLGSSRLAVQDPSSQPFVTGVGGTTLYAEPGGKLGLWNPNLGETALQSVWNDGKIRTSDGIQAAASTGGISTVWSMPRYQRRAASGLGVTNSLSSGEPCGGSGDCREVPDVSADGDPATGYVVYISPSRGHHGWTSEGGTSAAAPLWAALTAETDALPACRGASLGFENPSLYALAAAQPADIIDVTLPSPVTSMANNDALGTNHGLFPVTTGYDMTTGLGTPNAAILGAGLCALRAPVYAVSISAPAQHRLVVRAHVHLRFHGVDSGGLRLHFTASGLPNGLTLSRAGVLAGTPRQAGRYDATITATDRAMNRAIVHFLITVLPSPARIHGVFLTGVAQHRPLLRFLVAKGRDATGVRAIVVRVPAGLRLSPRPGGIEVSSGRHRLRFAVHRAGASLLVTLRRGVRSANVRIFRPTLTATQSLERTARRDRRVRVRVEISVSDARRRITRRAYRLKLR